MIHYRLTTEPRPTEKEASTEDELIVLDATTGKVSAYWLMTPVTNPITSDRWWQL